MGKNKGVNIVVDESFFKLFERDRQREQLKLRQKMGSLFNLSQRNFTAMLATKNFRFNLPKNRIVIKRRREFI